MSWGRQVHGYSPVKRWNRRSADSRSASVAALRLRLACWSRHPETMASNAWSSGRRSGGGPGEEQARSGAGDILRLAHVPAPEFFTMKESFIRCNRRSRTQVRARFPARPGAPWGVPLGRSLAAKCPVRAELAQGCEFLHQMQLASVVPQ